MKGPFFTVPCTLFLLVWSGLHLLSSAPSCSLLTAYSFYSVQHAPLKNWYPPINLYSIVIKKPRYIDTLWPITWTQMTININII